MTDLVDRIRTALHDPERELRMVAAHRKILDLHRVMPRPLRNGVPDGWGCGTCDDGEGTYNYPCPTVTALAAALQVEP